ncbi:protein-tyrosine-phosphatase [soil metagenome]
MHILFVCTGNICRSPTGERLTRAFAAAYLPDPSQLTAASVGTRAVVDHPMERNAERVLAGLGGDGQCFAARQIDRPDVEGADIVLTMTRDHRRVVLNATPRALPRTFTVREACSLLSLIDTAALPTPSELTLRGRALVAQMARQRALRPAVIDDSDDIPDPIGRDPETFLRIGDDIAAALIPWLTVCCGVAEPHRQLRVAQPA